jgi:hypothetical protein
VRDIDSQRPCDQHSCAGHRRLNVHAHQRGDAGVVFCRYDDDAPSGVIHADCLDLVSQSTVTDDFVVGPRLNAKRLQERIPNRRFVVHLAPFPPQSNANIGSRPFARHSLILVSNNMCSLWADSWTQMFDAYDRPFSFFCGACFPTSAAEMRTDSKPPHNS